MPANRKSKAAPADILVEAEAPHKIGYARVSTADQNPQLQIDALIAAGVDPADIYQEKISGASAKRPEFEAMLKDVREGDVVCVWKLDRLGRSNIGLHQTYELIRSKGADLVILTQPGLDSSTAVGRAMFAMLALFAQFERDIANERTRAGLASAREKGKIGGRRQRLPDAKILEIGKRLGMTKGAQEAQYSLSGFIKAFERAKAKRRRKK